MIEFVEHHYWSLWWLLIILSLIGASVVNPSKPEEK